MKRYIRAMMCIVTSLIRFGIIKVFNFKNFNFAYLQLISPLCQVEMQRDSKLSLGKMIRARSGSKIRVRTNGEIFIGNNTSFNHGCMLTCYDKIKIGKDVQFGPNVLIFDHDHDFKTPSGLKNLLYVTAPVEIGDNVWIGANVVILMGTKIGNNCVVGAGSIIKGNFPDNTVIVQKRETTVTEYNFNL
ncbi:acyltransferase [Cohnella faecalis]|uniref:Acyltransferase n=1 Tax=Cohnella faecalis TaxID=2315694 RepID=A0A398CP12_9BACL|nr:acyltransferase [Cohnella faecalis]RIE04303.1 acyltransferase [Cohnella faecalis]